MSNSWLVGWANLITWIIVFCGWFAVHKSTLSRERRKEKRESAQKVCADIQAIERFAIDFHTSPTYDSRKAADLRHDVDRLSRKLPRPPLDELSISQPDLIGFRQSITLRNFDLNDFETKQIHSAIVLNIRYSAEQLIANIETRKEQCWH